MGGRAKGDIPLADTPTSADLAKDALKLFAATSACLQGLLPGSEAGVILTIGAYAVTVAVGE